MQLLYSIQDALLKLHLPVFRVTDFVEILLVAVLIYKILSWLKTTRAWTLFRGIFVIGVFVAVAAAFRMTTILWIVQNVTSIAVVALIIILQPELRSALEQLGQNNFFRGLLNNSDGGNFSDRTIDEIIRACTVMSRARTGALIVVENKTPLNQYAKTGIEVDGIVTSQLLINIFEKNTPLHDGAVVLRGDRVVSATCYLPLSESKLDKELGTRHRAALGMSEATDSLIIVVSEETGNVSVASKGALERNVDPGRLKEVLVVLQDKELPEEKTGRFHKSISWVEKFTQKEPKEVKEETNDGKNS